LDNILRIDQWHDQPPTEYTFRIGMGSGMHNLKLEFYENGGGATAKLSWYLENTPPPTPPSGATITINDESGDFHRFGPTQYWNRNGQGDNGGSWNTLNSNIWIGDSANNIAEWVPTLDVTANYEVRVYIPNYASANNITYEVYGCGNQRNNVNVNQETNRGQWLTLGTFCMPQGHASNRQQVGGKVILTDVNPGAARVSRIVAFDTMQFIHK